MLTASKRQRYCLQMFEITLRFIEGVGYSQTGRGHSSEHKDLEKHSDGSCGCAFSGSVGNAKLNQEEGVHQRV